MLAGWKRACLRIDFGSGSEPVMLASFVTRGKRALHRFGDSVHPPRPELIRLVFHVDSVASPATAPSLDTPSANVTMDTVYPLHVFISSPLFVAIAVIFIHCLQSFQVPVCNRVYYRPIRSRKFNRANPVWKRWLTELTIVSIHNFITAFLFDLYRVKWVMSNIVCILLVIQAV